MSQYRLSSNSCGLVLNLNFLAYESQYRLSSNSCGPTDYQSIEKTMI